MSSYYVYFAIENGIVRYVGYGTGKRYLHCNSGTSHVRELNQKVLAEHVTFDVHIVNQFLTKKQAAELEKLYISRYRPIADGGTLFNKTYGGIGNSGGISSKMRQQISERTQEMWDSMDEIEKLSRVAKLQDGKQRRKKI